MLIFVENYGCHLGGETHLEILHNLVVVSDRFLIVCVVEAGVHNIITDKPKQMRKWFQKRQSLSKMEKVLLAFRVWLEQ